MTIALLTVGISWWAGRQNRRDEIANSRPAKYAAGTLALWGLAGTVTCAAWLPWLPSVRYHTSVLETAAKTFLFDEALDTSAYAGLTRDELTRNFRNLTHAPDRRPSSYWAKAKDCDVLIFVLETAPARCLPIEGDLSDCPNLARLRERAFVGARHHSTYPLTNRAVFSILSSWYPSTFMKAFPERHPNLIFPGLMQSLKSLGYRTAAYAPDALNYADDPLLQNLGIERRVYIETRYGNSAAPPAGETKSQRRLRLDQNCLIALKKDMLAWQRSGERFAALFLPQIGHAPWTDFTDGKEPDDLIALGRRLICEQDAWLGEILDQLVAGGRLDKTLIVVVGDHGTWNRWEAADFRPGIVEEQSFHIPLLLYAPGALEARTDIGLITSHIDIAPSLLDLLGVQIGRDSEQGTQLWDQRLRSRNTYLLANYLIGSDGYYSAEGRYCMWNHPNEIVYESARLFFDTTCLVPNGSPLHQEIVQHMTNVFALNEVWASSWCLAT